MDEAVPDGGLGEGAEVGAVDSRGVRLWVRQPGAAIARARLDVAGQQPAFGETALSTEQDWTGVILLRLATPAPGRAFVCTTGGRQLRGRLAPQRGTHAGVIFGVGSCNQPFRLDSGRVVLNEATAIYPA